MPSNRSLWFDRLGPLKGLIIRQPWANMVVMGEKKWEIRGFRVHFRGPVAIIAAGTGTVVGCCELVDCLGPLNLEMYNRNFQLMGSSNTAVETLPYQNTYAWVMAQPRAFQHPIPYSHPKGAVIWVKLPDETRQLTRDAERANGRLG